MTEPPTGYSSQTTINWAAAELPPEEVAVRAQEEIANLKLRIEELEARRRDAIEQAIAKGIKVYSGYTFVARTPSPVLDEGAFADSYGDIMDEYIDWYVLAHPARVTKTDLVRFLEKKHPEKAEEILAAISRENQGAETTYALVKKKGAE